MCHFSVAGLAWNHLVIYGSVLCVWLRAIFSVAKKQTCRMTTMNFKQWPHLVNNKNHVKWVVDFQNSKDKTMKLELHLRTVNLKTSLQKPWEEDEKCCDIQYFFAFTDDRNSGIESDTKPVPDDASGWVGGYTRLGFTSLPHLIDRWCSWMNWRRY